MINLLIGLSEHPKRADNVISNNKTDYEIGLYTVTLSRSERSVALGTEMLLCAQGDNAAMHQDIPVHLLIYITRSSQARQKRIFSSKAIIGANLRCPGVARCRY